MLKTNHLLPLLGLTLITLDSCTSSGSSASTSNPDTQTVAQNSVQEVALSEAQLEKARTNYASYCSGCHGEQMEAFTDRKWKHGSSAENLFAAIKHGYPEEGMPAFEQTFSDQEVTALVAYIQEGIQNVKQYDFSEEATASTVYTSEDLRYRVDTVATGMEIPWGMAFLPNSDMLITDRNGAFYRLPKGSRELQQISGAPEVLAQGQGGLLDVELHPDFANNNLIYLSYSAFKKEGEQTLSTTAVMRAKLEGNKITDQKVIFEAQPWTRTRHHYGSRLEFGRDGMLYVSVGDRGQHHENAQTIERSPGKVHRIKDDGAIPGDNPFANEKGAIASIWTIGNRNIQGMTIHPRTGAIWTNEHGPRGGDEVNIAERGKNYGWPVISYGINYNGTVLTELTKKEGMEQPLWYWVPSIAPSGMAFVTGNRYKGWEGDLLTGSLRFQFLSKLKMDGDKIISEEKLLKNIGRVRDVKMGPDGYIYVAVESPGTIYRVVPE
ncbi:PQQ-dependent sugar dehydrogenase [Pontibacter lucknowensis]|uniref:Glucose/arabinose dehydrogenase, beta-propeller fold n=1 Tax=Pontibacter lucknowensis TaxID=1077936 RepID=A0A1N6Y900_9BACT|nr:PQQ-dependent sugar dehydrogenase [Pontibacter lucknowensis]SIR10949.1 Glucose/arabinose dehydrogenase, beta-propeller fold [Pontibacter lucknowensis]